MARWWRRKREQAKAEPPADPEERREAATEPDAPAAEQPAQASATAATRSPKASRADADEAVKRLLEGAGPAAAARAEPASPAAEAPPAEPVAPREQAPPPDPPPVPRAESDAIAEPAAHAEDARSSDEGPERTEGELSELATKVQHLLESAEAAAAAIRREAELDAERLTEERERQQLARQEIRHLLRLADSLSVQAEMVQRQCGVLEGLLEPGAEESPDRAVPAEAPGAEPQVRDLRAERLENGGEPTGVSRERVEAYRMKLAGAPRQEVEEYLERAQVPDPGTVASEIFEPLSKSSSST